MDSHPDKYNDPRARITRRGILMGVAVVIVAAITAGFSIYARKTPLVETTKFWGPETITALQLAERIQLLPRGDETFPPVELTTTPGLGHLRRALLDERNFNWETTENTPVSADWLSSAELVSAELLSEDLPQGDTPLEEISDGAVAVDSDEAKAERKKHGPRSVQLRLTDPTGKRVGTIEIDLDLETGWVGPSDGVKRVQTTDYVRPKLRNYFKTVVNFQQKRYDDRP